MAAPMPRVPPVTTATRAIAFPLWCSLMMARRRGGAPAWWSALDGQGDAHAAADAQCREALLGVALLHFREQRHQDPGARGADRVADGDGAAVHVDLGGVPAEVLVDGDRLG